MKPRSEGMMYELPDGVGHCINTECLAVYRLPLLPERFDYWCPSCREVIGAFVGTDEPVDPMILAFQLLQRVHA